MATIEVSDDVVFDAASLLLENGFIVVNVTTISEQQKAVIDFENQELQEKATIEYMQNEVRCCGR